MNLLCRRPTWRCRWFIRCPFILSMWYNGGGGTRWQLGLYCSVLLDWNCGLSLFRGFQRRKDYLDSKRIKIRIESSVRANYPSLPKTRCTESSTVQNVKNPQPSAASAFSIVVSLEVISKPYCAPLADYIFKNFVLKFEMTINSDKPV